MKKWIKDLIEPMTDKDVYGSASYDWLIATGCVAAIFAFTWWIIQ